MNLAYCIDCMTALKHIPDKYFDLAVVDPPYGLPKSSSRGSGKLKSRIFHTGDIKRWDKAPDKEYFSELFRVSKNQIIWGGNYFSLPPCWCFVVWDKLQPWENFSRCEYAWTSFNRPTYFNSHILPKVYDFRRRLSLWIYPKSDCFSCCLVCKHFDNNCRDGLVECRE